MMILLWLAVFVSNCLCNNDIYREIPYVPEAIVPQLNGRIVGGVAVNISAHPHQVSIQHYHRHICGGSLISPNWVVTAAHCITRGRATFTVRMGTSLHFEGGLVHTVAQIINHPLYNTTDLSYDISLIQLSRNQSEVLDEIRYIPLPPDGTQPSVGSMAVVTGWGTPFAGAGYLMEQLQEVSVPIVSLESCQEYYGILDLSVTDQMLCAGFINGGYDACQGDSGGPLLVNGVLTGVVSWGNGCGWANYPGVYSNVPNLRSWIREITGI